MRGTIFPLSSWRHQKTVWKYRLVFLWFWGAFGPLLAPFSTPFGHPGSLLASLWMPFGSFWKRLGPPRICRDSAATLPRFSREFAEIREDSAENLPSFCQEFAEIQPRTRSMNPKQTCLSHCDFFEWTAFSDKHFDKIAGNKSGAAVSPLGGLRLNNLQECLIGCFAGIICLY